MPTTDEAYRRGIIKNINAHIQVHGPDLVVLNDLVTLCREEVQEVADFDKRYWFQVSKYAKATAARLLSSTGNPQYGEAYYAALLFEAPHLFESYLYYMERYRNPKDRFYEPRAKTLGVVAHDLQDLEDQLIKFYGLSLPSRTGKSTIAIFFMSFHMGRHPESHNAMGGHSGVLAKGFHKELLNLIDTREYAFAEIFPGIISKTGQVIESKSAEDLTINLGKPDRFPTMTCRGIDGTWTGAIDISPDGILYTDDLIRDREHSLSAIREENTYQEYLNKMVDRMNDGAMELMIGTLWNVLDPLERERKKRKNDPYSRFRRIPALDEVTDESNFNYAIKGFSTEYYRNMRSRLEKAEWMAKFQQKPFVREGLLLPSDELRYWNGILPDGDYRIVAACDVAWGGGDSLSMPIGAEYESGDVYIIDWVFNSGPKEVTIPLVVGKILAYKIRQIRFEANNGGDMYCLKVSEELQKHKFACACTHKKAPGRMEKMSKMNAYAGDIKRNFIFLTDSVPSSAQLNDDAQCGIKRYYRSAEYQSAMDEATMTSMTGDNEHDDACDGLTQLAMVVERPENTQASILKGGPWGRRGR